jgi:hypothetical protein
MSTLGNPRRNVRKSIEVARVPITEAGRRALAAATRAKSGLGFAFEQKR